MFRVSSGKKLRGTLRRQGILAGTERLSKIFLGKVAGNRMFPKKQLEE